MTRVTADEATERLIRVRTKRRVALVDLRVHYEIRREKGCDTYRILAVDEMEISTNPIDLVAG